MSRTPWLMPLTSASTGLPLLSMASLAGAPRDERSAGAVLGVTRSGSDLANGADSPGSLVSGDEAERQPKRVAASTGDGADLLLPFLLTMVLLALLALVVVARNRRSTSTSIIENPTPLSEARAAAVPAHEAPLAPATAPWTADQPSEEAVEEPDDEPALEPEPEPEAAVAPVDADPEPQVQEEPPPAVAAAPAAFTRATPVREAKPEHSNSRRARNIRLGASAAALAAGGVIRALLRVRRRR